MQIIIGCYLAKKAASDIIRASEIAGEVMAGFLTDYGGIIEGMWPGNYFLSEKLDWSKVTTNQW